MLVLNKMSIPDWEFRSQYIENIYEQLDAHICSACKQTEAGYRKATQEVDAEYDEDFYAFKPEAFSQWSHLEKIEWLLGTACGCEFYFEKID